MDPYCGEIRLFGGSYAPVNWEICQGQMLRITDFPALYSLLGTIYGGDGVATFGIPDLRGRVPISMGTGTGLTARTLGQKGGASYVQILEANIPAHTHALKGSVKATDTPKMANGVGLATTASSATGIVTRYANPSATTAPTKAVMDSLSITPAPGGSQPHVNVMPYLAINYIICVTGLYPEKPQ